MTRNFKTLIFSLFLAINSSVFLQASGQPSLCSFFYNLCTSTRSRDFEREQARQALIEQEIKQARREREQAREARQALIEQEMAQDNREREAILARLVLMPVEELEEAQGADDLARQNQRQQIRELVQPAPIDSDSDDDRNQRSRRR